MYIFPFYFILIKNLIENGLWLTQEIILATKISQFGQHTPILSDWASKLFYPRLTTEIIGFNGNFK